jgi:hypothetical protein
MREREIILDELEHILIWLIILAVFVFVFPYTRD